MLRPSPGVGSLRRCFSSGDGGGCQIGLGHPQRGGRAAEQHAVSEKVWRAMGKI